MEIPIELPLDADGFLRRECPTCELEFKWHHGPTEGTPDGFVEPPVYWCPRCGRSAKSESWWTPAQLDYQQQVAGASVGDIVGDMLKDAFTPNKRSMISFEVSPIEVSPMPDPLVEPDDMVMVTSPCHAWEPVKVPADANAPFYCLACGQPYVV